MSEKTNDTTVSLMLRNYLAKVNEMREMQRTYFAAEYGSTQRKSALGLCKRLEAEVDKMSKAIPETLKTLGY